MKQSFNDTQGIVDILMVIDAETLVKNYPKGTAENPTVVPAPLIYLIADSKYVAFGQATKELKIAIKTLDEIRWRSTTLSLESIYCSLLYKFELVHGEPIISTPTALLADVQVPLPDMHNPLHPRIQEIKNYFWSSTALNSGEMTYTFYFMILDRDNTPLGYYFWDPFIKITN
jgi:hypothetical protein